MSKIWPGRIDDLFSIWTVSYGWHMNVLSPRFILCSTLILAGLPYLQNVVDLGHSVQFSILNPSLPFQLVCNICHNYCRVFASQYPVIGSTKLPYNDFFPKCLSCCFWLSAAENVSHKGSTTLHSDTIWYNREYIVCHIREIDVLYAHVFWLPQQFSDNGYRKCSAILHRAGVVIIKIRIKLLPVLWIFKWWIQMQPCGHR